MFRCELQGTEGSTEGGSTTLKLAGEVTVQYARELKDALQEGLGGERLIVDAREAAAVDLSCLQLICSAHRAALASGKELLLEAGDLTEILDRAGYAPRPGCSHPQSDESCLWAALQSAE